jgi:hypothetical protein
VTMKSLIKLHQERTIEDPAGALLPVSGVVDIIPCGIRKFKVVKNKFFAIISATDVGTTTPIEICLSDEVCQQFLGITPTEYGMERKDKSKSELNAHLQQYGLRFAKFEGAYWAEVVSESGDKLSGAEQASQGNAASTPTLLITRKAVG